MRRRQLLEVGALAALGVRGATPAWAQAQAQAQAPGQAHVQGQTPTPTQAQVPTQAQAPTQAQTQSATPGWLSGGVTRDADGGLVGVFGLDPDLALDILRPATRTTALPDGYQPTDLTSANRAGIASTGAQLLRQVIVEDTSALVQAARADGVDVYIGSGYRSQAYQASVFAAQVARWGSSEAANRYSAQPGHSQHQLGTTIDFTDDFRAFRQSAAPAWLQAHAHEFGFVLPYTDASQPMTGYVPEPWHARWVGRPLAGALQAAGYQDWTDACADDALVDVVRAAAGATAAGAVAAGA